MFNTTYLSQLNDDREIKIPEKSEVPVSASEKLVREETKKLKENTEEMEKIRQEIERGEK